MHRKAEHVCEAEIKSLDMRFNIDESIVCAVAGSRVPTFKKGAHKIFANPKTEIFGGWGVGLREKKHELCQIVLNKQQHLHDAIIAFNFDH